MARRAFTLIELLVVISIIALLIAILLPVLSSVRESAKMSQCTVNLRSVGQALYTYAVDNNGEFPDRTHIQLGLSLKGTELKRPTFDDREILGTYVDLGKLNCPFLPELQTGEFPGVDFIESTYTLLHGWRYTSVPDSQGLLSIEDQGWTYGGKTYGILAMDNMAVLSGGAGGSQSSHPEPSGARRVLAANFVSGLPDVDLTASNPDLSFARYEELSGDAPATDVNYLSVDGSVATEGGVAPGRTDIDLVPHFSTDANTAGWANLVPTP